MVAMVAMALPADAPLSAQSVADAEAAYARVMKSWSTTRTLQANFDQTITNPILGRTVASRGVFVQERPNRVSITFTEPAGDRIVGDGKSLWVYLPSSTPGQVLKLPADADDWLAGATEHAGSWWPDWSEWLRSRAGKLVPAPRQPGSRQFKAIEPAPGRYVKAKA